MPRTDHSEDIVCLRADAESERLLAGGSAFVALALDTAAELLEVHDDTGISLDNWTAPRAFVELLIKHPITENGA